MENPNPLRLLSEARALAQRAGWHEQAVVYVTRPQEEIELLTLAHTSEQPEAGHTIPAASIKKGETPEAAAIRIVWEKTGLQLDEACYLESYSVMHADQQQIWHFYWVPVSPDTPERWVHQLVGETNNQDRPFLCAFVPLKKVDLIEGDPCKAGLNMLALYILH